MFSNICKAVFAVFLDFLLFLRKMKRTMLCIKVNCCFQ